MDPAGEVAELLERLARPGPRLGEQQPRAFGVAGELLLGHPDAHPERDQAGLRAVVEIALDPAKLGLLHVDRAGTGRLELLDPMAPGVLPPREDDRRVDACDDAEARTAPSPARSSRGR